MNKKSTRSTRYVIQIANGAINCLQGLPIAIAKAAHTASIGRRATVETYTLHTHTRAQTHERASIFTIRA